MKLKARQFSRGGSSANRGAPNNLWTETPAERQQRIADEVAGKKRRAANAEEDPSVSRDERKKRKNEEDIRNAVEAHNVGVVYDTALGDLLILAHRNLREDSLLLTCTLQKRRRTKGARMKNLRQSGTIRATWRSVDGSWTKSNAAR